MSLLDDVSIVVTPNGYKAGELYAVIPVPTLGAEEVTNGEFTTDLTGWDNGGTGTSVWDTGRAKLTTTGTGYIKPISAITTVVGARYEFLVTLTGTGNTANVRAGTSSLGVDLFNSGWGVTDGSHIYYFVATTTTTYIAVGNGSASVSYIDNVSVKELTSADMDVTRATAATRVDENGLVNYAEVLGGEEVTDGDFPTPNTNWTLSGFTISDNKLHCVSDGTYNNAIQSNVFVIGRTYKITFDITGWTLGDIRVRPSGQSPFQLANANGSYTFYYTATNHQIAIERNTPCNMYLENLVVKEVTRDNVPRIDYTGGGCPHILAEPQRRNLVIESEDFEDASYGEYLVSYTPNFATSPSGVSNATKLTSSGVYGNVNLSFTKETSAITYTQSIFIKANNYTLVNFISYGASSGDRSQVTYDLSSGTISSAASSTGAFSNASAKITSYTNNYYKISLTYTTDSSAQVRPTISFPVAMDITNYVIIWGMQLEEGSYPTSYIPTSGSTVTRNQDIFTRDGIGSLINSTEGCVFGEGNFAESNSSIYNYFVSLSDGTPNNRLEIRQSASNLQFLWRVATYQSEISTSSLDVSSNFKFALNYSASNIKFYVNGDLIGTINTPTLWSANTLNRLAFDNGAGGDRLSGKVKQLQVYDTSLSDEQLLQLTGESGTDFYESYAEMASALTYTIQ